MINLGTSTMQDFTLGDNLVDRIDLGVTTIFDPYTTLTGTLPLSFNSRIEGALKNYRVYGTASGAGIKTEQLFDMNAKDTDNGFGLRKYIVRSGNLSANSNYNVSEYIPIQAGIQYCLYWAYTESTQPAVVFYDSNKQYLSGKTYGSSSNYVFTPEVDGYLRCSYRINLASEISLTEGDEPATELIYGYKILFTLTSDINSDDYVAYIGNSQLGATEYIDFVEQKVYKDVSGIIAPTDPPVPFPPINAYEGENTLSDSMAQTKAYSLEQGNYGGDPGGQLFKHNSSHNYYNKAIRVPSILTVPAGQKWLIATKIGWATTVRIADSSGIVTSITGTNGATTDPIVIEASTSERKLGIHTSHLVNGSVVPCVPSDYGGDLEITVVDAGALGSMMIKGRISAS